MKESENIIVLSFKIGKIFILIPDEIKKELKE
jgi:predicted membrane protein